MAVLAAVCMTGVLLALGLVVDVGSWHTDKARLQQGADAAAVSGAQFYLAMLTGTPEPATNPCAALASATDCAQHVADLNGVTLAATPQLVTVGDLTGVQVMAQDTSAPNFFAKLIGLHPTVSASSTASVVGPGSEKGAVMPVAVSDDAAAQWQSGQLIHLSLDGATDGFIPSSLPDSQPDPDACGNTRADLVNCIRNGCGCTVTVGDSIVDSPCACWHETQVQNRWAQQNGKTVLAAVYDSSSRVAGFATFTVGPSLPNDDIQVTFKGVTTAASGSVTGKFFGTASVSITQ